MQGTEQSCEEDPSQMSQRQSNVLSGLPPRHSQGQSTHLIQGQEGP